MERSGGKEMRLVEQIASGGWCLLLSLCVQAEYGFGSLALKLSIEFNSEAKDKYNIQ